MIKRGVVIGIGTVFLVLGLAGLGLLQTGVIYPPEVKSPDLAATGGQQSRVMVSQTEPQPAAAPPSGELAQAAPSAQGGQQPPPAGLTPQKPIPVPQAGKDERPRPEAGSRTAQAPQPPASYVGGRGIETSHGGPGSQARKPKLDDRSRMARLKSDLKRYARSATPAHTVKPVVIRFTFHPAHNRRRLDVAQVHLGDRIMVKVRRVGQVDRRVYFTFSTSLNSPQGAVLELDTMRSFEPYFIYRPGRGYYVVEVKIYPRNRWNIMPRSFV